MRGARLGPGPGSVAVAAGARGAGLGSGLGSVAVAAGAVCGELVTMAVAVAAGAVCGELVTSSSMPAHHVLPARQPGRIREGGEVFRGLGFKP